MSDMLNTSVIGYLLVIMIMVSLSVYFLYATLKHINDGINEVMDRCFDKLRKELNISMRADKNKGI